MKRLLGISILLGIACAPKVLIQPAYDHFTAGAMYETEGKLDQALAEYRTAHALNPHSKEILMSYVKVLYGFGRYKEALPYVQKLITIDPNDFNSYALLGNTYMQLGRTEQGLKAYRHRLAIRENDEFLYSLGGLYESVNKLSDALAIYEKLSAQNPRSADFLFAEANTLRKLKRYDQALVRYHQVIGFDTSYALAYLGSGICFEEAKQSDSAVVMYERFRQYQPKDTLVRKRLVELYVRLKRFDDAWKLAEEVLVELPFDLDMRQLAGYALYKTGRSADALGEFLIACGIEPKDAYSLLHIGKILADRQNYPRAEQYLKRAEAAKPDLSETWTTLGLLYLETKKYDDALHDFQKALRLKGNLADNDYFIGLVWEAKKNLPRALRFYLESLKYNTGNPRVWFSLGTLYDELKQDDNALNCFRWVLELDSLNASAYNYIAYLYAERSDSLEQAQRFIKKALTIEPDNGYFIDTYGWIYFQLGRYGDAIRELERAAAVVKDAVIYDHLGDAYDKAGLRDKALEMWKKGVELDPKNEKIKAKIESR
jgi:tetratricopeptide (TPR) repeat protein